MMAPYTMLTGLLLTALSAWGYFGAELDKRSGTAFIPAGFGIPLLILGFLATKEHLRKHAMHAAAMIGLLGFLGATIRLILVLSKTDKAVSLSERGPMALLMMAILCALFVALCVNSFIQARRARQQREQSV